MHIYALCDPGAQLVRYVGRTSHHLRSRLSTHMASGKHSPATARDYWLHSLVIAGREPDMHLLESADDWHELLSAERFWIWAFLHKGYPLTNQLAGDAVELDSEHWKNPARFLNMIPVCPLQFQQPPVDDPSLESINTELRFRWRPLPNVLKFATYTPPAGWSLPDWADATFIGRIRKNHRGTENVAKGAEPIAMVRRESCSVRYDKKATYMGVRHQDTLSDLARVLRRHDLPDDRSMIVRALIDMAADGMQGCDAESWTQRFADYCRQTPPGTSASGADPPDLTRR